MTENPVSDPALTTRQGAGATSAVGAPELTGPSVRQLLTELAGLEDELRECPAAERRAALERERAILSELHALNPTHAAEPDPSPEPAA